MWLNRFTSAQRPVNILCDFCAPLSRKRGDIKSHSSVCLSVRPSVCLSVTKTLTLAVTFALLQVEPWYLTWVFFVTRPFRWYHVVTLTVTFDLLQGQICCRAEDHNSLNLLVLFRIVMKDSARREQYANYVLFSISAVKKIFLFMSSKSVANGECWSRVVVIGY